MKNRIINFLLRLLHAEEIATSKKVEKKWKNDIAKHIQFSLLPGGISFYPDGKSEAAEEVFAMFKLLAQGMNDMLDGEEIPNYLQTDVNDFLGRRFTIIAVKHSGQTPYQLQKRAEWWARQWKGLAKKNLENTSTKQRRNAGDRG